MRSFLPTTPEELTSLGWDKPDIILITGDSYIDSSYIGVAVIGRHLSANGFKVAVIAQPDIHSDKDITRLGEPALFWGVTGGSVDSMVANYTALKKKRKSDDFTPGGVNNRRPDRAVIVYSNLIRKHYKNTRPIVLGGIEASLRRIAHYDYWANAIRKSILFDAKADYLLYGMAEKPIINLARVLKQNGNPHLIKSLCYISKNPPDNYISLPSFEDVVNSKKSFTDMFHTFYKNNDPITATGLKQKTDTRWLVQNPPEKNLLEKELDTVYEYPYTRRQHPHYEQQGQVKALETIRFSLTTHRGCHGECNFCAIAVHQGQTVHGRTEASVINEAKAFTTDAKFNGTINDVGGPTANMYGYECQKKIKRGCCDDKRCLFPERCEAMRPDHSRQISLLKKLAAIPKVKNLFVASGIRYDLIMADTKHGRKYLTRLTDKHTSGQMKIAPEHVDPKVLELMGKPPQKSLTEFNRTFRHINDKMEKKRFLTYYLIAAHPGCTEDEMKSLKSFTNKELKLNPEQVQIFTPLPSTYSALMYYTEKDPFTGKKVYIEKDLKRKQTQKEILISKRSVYNKKKHPQNRQ